MTTKPAQILVVAPHPDDAEFGAADTIARWARGGADIVYLICTNGDKGTSDPAMTSLKLAKFREKEQRAAARILGVREVVFLNYPDQGLEDTPGFRKDIVRVIRQFKPNTVVTCDPYRRYISHRDHRVAGQATLDAVYPTARDLLAFPDLAEQGFLPHKVKEVYLWGSDEPNYFSDIAQTFELKMAALCCHKSQIWDSAELEERMMQRCKTTAEGTSYEMAEAFYHFELTY
ncbi:MAG: PIG-L deacetylase family protein [Dehalococcoidales bacterium]|nr:PIG-L deacetylase family protein [Dehalococcoidales bacterium]